MTTDPLLSICVPTYNRAAMLRVMLEAVLPQVAAEHGAVELCLCDNASSDDTSQVVCAAQAIGPLRAARNNTNLGPIGNFNRVANELARGEYVWLLGDDDLVRPGAVRRVVAALRGNQDLDAFYVNFNAARYSEHWPHRAPGGYDGPCDYTIHAGAADRRVDRWEELISPHNSFCTQVYVHILRRPIWRGLTHNGVLGEPYSSFRWTWPHTYMAAKAMFGRPAYFIGEPALTIFNRRAEWFGQMRRMTLEYLPALLRFYERLGLPRDRAAELRAHVDELSRALLRRLLLGMEPAGDLTPWSYLRRNWHRPRTWRLGASVLGKLYGDWRFFGAAMVPPKSIASPPPVTTSARRDDGKLKVCFVARHAYPLFVPSVAQPVGESEAHSVLYARELAKCPGYNVALLVHDCGQPPVQQVDGMTVVADPLRRENRRRIERLFGSMRWHANRVRECLPRSARFPGFRVARLRPRLAWDIAAVLGQELRSRWLAPPPVEWCDERPAPQSVYRDIGADIYVSLGANQESAKVVASCREYGGVSVLLLTSDADLCAGYLPGSRQRDSAGELCGVCYYAIAHADVLLVQTAHQQRLLKERFDRESIVVPASIVRGEPPDASRPSSADGEMVVWTGRADRQSKRVTLRREAIAQRADSPCPLIGHDRQADLFENHPPTGLADRYAVAPRLPAEMLDVFDRTRALGNTSHR